MLPFPEKVQTMLTLAITRDGNHLARQIRQDIPVAIRSNVSLEAHLSYPRSPDVLKKNETAERYLFANTSWCVAAVCGTRAVIKMLQEYGAGAIETVTACSVYWCPCFLWDWERRRGTCHNG